LRKQFLYLFHFHTYLRVSLSSNELSLRLPENVIEVSSLEIRRALVLKRLSVLVEACLDEGLLGIEVFELGQRLGILPQL